MAWNITNDNKALLVELMQEEPRVPYWQIAQELGVHENTVTRMMRAPNDEQAERVAQAIGNIRKRQGRA